MKKAYGPFLALMSIFLLFGSCTNPFSFAPGNENVPSDASPSLRLAFSVPAPKTWVPNSLDIDNAIVLYAVKLTRSGYADVTATAPRGGVLALRNLPVGDWDIQVQALDGGGSALAFGEALAVPIINGVTAERTINLELDNEYGYGDIALSLLFPKNIGIDAAAVTLKSGTTIQTIPVSVGDVEDEADGDIHDKIDIVAYGIRAGSPLVSVVFMKGGNQVGWLNEVVWVFRGIPTKAERCLGEGFFGKAPSAPAALALSSSVDDGAVCLVWTPNSLVAENYIVQRATTASGPWTTLSSAISPGTLWYMDQDVVPGAAYYYQVTASNRFGTSAPVSGLAAMPSAPVMLGRLGINRLTEDYGYWINGIFKKLAAYPGSLSSEASNLELNGASVYVAGNLMSADEDTFPVLWTNGVPTPLPSDDVYGGYAVDVASVGSDLYVSGNRFYYDEYYERMIQLPVYWINGSECELAVNRENDVEEYICGEIAVEGENVYIAGFAYNQYFGAFPVYWKNGELHELSPANEVGYYDLWTMDLNWRIFLRKQEI